MQLYFALLLLRRQGLHQHICWYELSIELNFNGMSAQLSRRQSPLAHSRKQYSQRKATAYKPSLPFSRRLKPGPETSCLAGRNPTTCGIGEGNSKELQFQAALSAAWILLPCC